jgi:uncharacterized protein YcfJ
MLRVVAKGVMHPCARRGTSLAADLRENPGNEVSGMAKQARWIQAVAASASLTLAGCYSQSSWTPAVDPYADRNPDHISEDLYECKQIALRASGGTAEETLKGGVVGGLVGAAAGAAIGAAAGDPGKGAAIGAAAGGIGGGTYKGLSSEDSYRRAYRDCMEGRGHRVVG